MFCNFESLLKKFKDFITALMLNNYSCRSPRESFSKFRKSGENFNLEELTNPILAGCNFTKNFTVDVLWEFSETPKTISTTGSPGNFINQLHLK